jgi:hypothetical protein
VPHHGNASAKPLTAGREPLLRRRCPDEASRYLLLAAAFLSFVFSVYLWFQGLREEGLFVGIWVPSILAFGGFIRSALRRT